MASESPGQIMKIISEDIEPTWGERQLCTIGAPGGVMCSNAPMVVALAKLIFIAIPFDIIDFFILPILSLLGIATPTDLPGTLYDFIGLPIALVLWKKEGLIMAFELFFGSYGNIVDGFLPSMTIVALVDMGLNKPWKRSESFQGASLDI